MASFHGINKMPYFEFAGVNSLTTHNVRLTKKPDIPTAKIRKEEVYVAGRNSTLTFTDGTYEDITITIGLRFRHVEADVQDKMTAVNNWLQGYQFQDKPLTFSQFPKWVFKVKEVLPYSWDYFPATGEWYCQSIQFVCRPFRNGTTQTYTLKPTVVWAYDGEGSVAPNVAMTTKANAETLTVNAQNQKTGRSQNLTIKVPDWARHKDIHLSLTNKTITCEGKTITNQADGSFPIVYGGVKTGFSVGGTTYDTKITIEKLDS